MMREASEIVSGVFNSFGLIFSPILDFPYYFSSHLTPSSRIIFNIIHLICCFLSFLVSSVPKCRCEESFSDVILVNVIFFNFSWVGSLLGCIVCISYYSVG